MFERIVSKPKNLVSYNKGSIISSQDIEYAVRLVLSSELAKQAMFEGTKAVNRYKSIT